MDVLELKKEQLKLAPKIILSDGFTKLKTIAGIDCIVRGNKLLAGVIVCDYPSFKIKEKKTYLLADPLPYIPGFLAYREMPAMIEAYNLLEEEPDLILVDGPGIAHPRRLGIASHLGLALNKPTIGVTNKLTFGTLRDGKLWSNQEILGFEIKTREHSNPIYVSPGHLVSLGTALRIISETICLPHKMPEPLHLTHKLVKRESYSNR
jgi:deoxyribonuclease V